MAGGFWLVTDWPAARSLIRRALLVGDVRLYDGSYDTPKSHGRGGLDNGSFVALRDLMRAMTMIREQDRVVHQLLVREIGRPCAQRSHEVPQGHCHRIPLREMPLLAEMSWEEAERETERAVDWLVSVVS